MAEVASLEQEMLAYLRETVASVDGLQIDTDLIEKGLLDSLLVGEITAQIENRYGVPLGIGDIAPANFRSAASLARMIRGKLGQRGRAA